MKLVYIKGFIPKEEGLPNLKINSVYEADSDEDNLVINVDGEKFIVDRTSQSGPRFDADIVEITKDNYSKFSYNEDDSKKVMDYFIRPIIEGAIKKAESEHNNIYDTLRNNMTTLSADIELTESLAKVTSHLVNTFKDKYENGSNEVELTGLMRCSPHSTGFNIGNTLKYCKRYMTIGYDKSFNVEDLYKAVHYLLLEIISNKYAQKDDKE